MVSLPVFSSFAAADIALHFERNTPSPWNGSSGMDRWVCCQAAFKKGKKIKGGGSEAFIGSEWPYCTEGGRPCQINISLRPSPSGKSLIFLPALRTAQAVSITTWSLSALKRLWVFPVVSRKCLCTALVPPWMMFWLLCSAPSAASVAPNGGEECKSRAHRCPAVQACEVHFDA